MATNNPNVAGKQHRQQMGQHCNKLDRLAADVSVWIDTIQQQHHDFYSAVMQPLTESTNPADQALFDELDREYSRQCASLQAAQERLIEACAHIKNGILAKGHTGHLSNTSPEDFL